jgi:hypothetical protein
LAPVRFPGGAGFFFPLALAAQTDVPEAPEANPGRPTVTTPAPLSPVGYLQFENGALNASDSPEFSTCFGINQVIRLAVTSCIQLLKLSEPFVHSAGSEVPGVTPGEVFAALPTVLLKGDGNALLFP